MHKLIASVAVLGAAAAIAGLGTYATFTSSTSASHTIATGTLSLTSGPTNRLGTGASLVAAGDSMQRAIDLNYAGSISFGSATLTTSASPSSALDTDATDGLHVAIDKCSVAWTESGPPYTYTCGGSTSTVLASSPRHRHQRGAVEPDAHRRHDRPPARDGHPPEHGRQLAAEPLFDDRLHVHRRPARRDEPVATPCPLAEAASAGRVGASIVVRRQREL